MPFLFGYLSWQSDADAMSTTEADQAQNMPQARSFAAVASLFGAVATSSCCMLPLLLFALGAGGAWIGPLVRLAPYQPYFIAATVACLGYGYWLVYRSSNIACADGESCARPAPNRLVKLGLILATVLVIAAIGFDFF